MTFADKALALSDARICNEAHRVMQCHEKILEDEPEKGALLLSLNQQPVAWTDPHGAWIAGITNDSMHASEDTQMLG